MSRKSILVIEDDRMMLDLYKNTLEEQCDLLLVFYEGSHTSLSSENFDRLLIDGLDGKWIDVVSDISAQKKILCSGSRHYKDMAETRGLAFLEKPVSRNVLLEALR